MKKSTALKIEKLKWMRLKFWTSQILIFYYNLMLGQN